MTAFLGIILLLWILAALFLPAPVTSVSTAFLKWAMRTLGAVALAGVVLSCVNGFLVMGTQIALLASIFFMIVVWMESGPHLPTINWKAFDAARSFWSDAE